MRKKWRSSLRHYSVNHAEQSMSSDESKKRARKAKMSDNSAENADVVDMKPDIRYGWSLRVPPQERRTCSQELSARDCPYQYEGRKQGHSHT